MLIRFKTLWFKAWWSDWGQYQVRLLHNKTLIKCLIMALNWEIDPKFERW